MIGGETVRSVSVDVILGTILLLALCVGIGEQANRLLFAKGVLLPGFLTAMVVGIVLTSLADARGRRPHMSARSYRQVLHLAWITANMAGNESIEPPRIGEAVRPRRPRFMLRP